MPSFGKSTPPKTVTFASSDPGDNGRGATATHQQTQNTLGNDNVNRWRQRFDPQSKNQQHTPPQQPYTYSRSHPEPSRGYASSSSSNQTNYLVSMPTIPSSQASSSNMEVTVYERHSSLLHDLHNARSKGTRQAFDDAWDKHFPTLQSGNQNSAALSALVVKIRVFRLVAIQEGSVYADVRDARQWYNIHDDSKRRDSIRRQYSIPSTEPIPWFLFINEQNNAQRWMMQEVNYGPMLQKCFQQFFIAASEQDGVLMPVQTPTEIALWFAHAYLQREIACRDPSASSSDGLLMDGAQLQFGYPYVLELTVSPQVLANNHRRRQPLPPSSFVQQCLVFRNADNGYWAPPIDITNREASIADLMPTLCNAWPAWGAWLTDANGGGRFCNMWRDLQRFSICYCDMNDPMQNNRIDLTFGLIAPLVCANDEIDGPEASVMSNHPHLVERSNQSSSNWYGNNPSRYQQNYFKPTSSTSGITVERIAQSFSSFVNMFRIPSYQGEGWLKKLGQCNLCPEHVFELYRHIPPSSKSLDVRNGHWHSRRVKMIGCGLYTVLFTVPWLLTHEPKPALRIVKLFDTASVAEQYKIVTANHRGQMTPLPQNPSGMVDFYSSLFRLEVSIALRLPKHDHVCRSYGWFTYDGKIGLLMERLECSFDLYLAALQTVLDGTGDNMAFIKEVLTKYNYDNDDTSNVPVFWQQQITSFINASRQMGQSPNLKLVVSANIHGDSENDYGDDNSASTRNAQISANAWRRFKWCLSRAFTSTNALQKSSWSVTSIIASLLANTLSYFSQVATGLAHLHANGVAHCDVKPCNIMLNESGSRAVVIDMGGATMFNNLILQTVTGTKRYQTENFLGKQTTRVFLYEDGVCDTYGLLSILDQDVRPYVKRFLGYQGGNQPNLHHLKQLSDAFWKDVLMWIRPMESILVSISSDDTTDSRILMNGTHRPLVVSEVWGRWRTQTLGSSELITSARLASLLADYAREFEKFR